MTSPRALSVEEAQSALIVHVDVPKRRARVIPIGGEPVGEWVESANCRTQDELFFSPLGPDWTQAKEICHECPVRAACLDYALRTRQLHGTWGGSNQLELRLLLAVDAIGRPKRHATQIRCPWCHKAAIDFTPPPPRSGDPETAECRNCAFQWERVHVPKRGRRKSQ